MHLSKSQKESLSKSFLLFFMVMELFLTFIFYNYYQIEEEHLSAALFLEMKNDSFLLDNEKFEMDIVPTSPTQQFYELYFDEKQLYILVPFPQDNKNSLAIIYPLESYQQELSHIKEQLLGQLILLSIVALLIALAFSFYALKPLKDALELLEEFIKDIIHDLNTPITSILINLKMMNKSEETKSIAQSANAIAMLHKNLDIYLKESHFKKEPTEVAVVLEEQIAYFKSLYGYLKWECEISPLVIESNSLALSRIFYNLLSNACKYNTSNGFIKIELSQHHLKISNDSYDGIKKPNRVFERFYKEGERGLGIGLHIVEKLCDELEIKKSLELKERVVTMTLSFEI